MKIPFEHEHRRSYYALLDEVFDSSFMSEGGMVKRFEQEFEAFCGLPSLAVVNGGAGLLALYEYAGVKGHDVIVPANTFWATAAAAKKAGANVIYADCNREDLCLSLADLKKKMTSDTKAVTVVHIGGHIAFEIEAIAEFCAERGVSLIEDCAHAHGAVWNGATAGSYGLGGAYSFYATKTMPLGEGGMVVSRDRKFLEWMRYYRNYGKHVEAGRVSYVMSQGFNYRMNEVTAALGVVQMRRLPEILRWKRELAAKYDRVFERRVMLPDAMVSGYYKYIVFDTDLTEQTGQVFAVSDFGNEIEGVRADVPNSYWAAEHHHCAPIWFGWDKSGLSPEELAALLIKKT